VGDGEGSSNGGGGGEEGEGGAEAPQDKNPPAGAGGGGLLELPGKKRWHARIAAICGKQMSMPYSQKSTAWSVPSLPEYQTKMRCDLQFFEAGV
jgi:hypothetical protein